MSGTLPLLALKCYYLGFSMDTITALEHYEELQDDEADPNQVIG